MNVIYIKNLTFTQNGVNSIVSIDYDGEIKGDVNLVNTSTNSVINTGIIDSDKKIISFTINESLNGSFFDVKISDRIIYNFKFNFFTDIKKIKQFNSISYPIYEHTQYYEAVALDLNTETKKYVPPMEYIEVEGEKKEFGNLKNLDYDRGFSEGLLIGQMI